MLAYFSVRFVVAVFGGAALGLLIGFVAVHAFGADWNPYSVMPWTIMAACLTLVFIYVMKGQTAKETGSRR